jgi:hypothetical protein
MRGVVLFTVLSALLSSPLVLADRGSIPFKPNVRIFEPNQRAIIAWNGTEEILLLSTDLRASEPTKVLEVIPLPSEPAVKEGDVETFKIAIKIINRKIRRPAVARGRVTLAGDSARVPAGEVTFHEKIGAHDISVTRVIDAAGFIEWVENYLRKQGVDTPKIPQAMKDVVNEYLQDKYRWFVFDVVELSDKTKTNDAIQYRFKTNSLYYPMRITRTESGETSVELIILTPRLLNRFPGIPFRQIRLKHKAVTLTSHELKQISEEMDSLLGHRPGMKLRIWEITGTLSEFKEDLIAR